MKVSELLKLNENQIDDIAIANEFADEWSDEWSTADLELAKKKGLMSALKIYPFNSKEKLYRGLTLPNEKFLALKKATNNFTIYESDKLSSWTRDFEHAGNFASFHFDELYHQDLSGDVTGLIISTVYDGQTSAIDIRESPAFEDEVILFPGKFKIKLEQMRAF